MHRPLALTAAIALSTTPALAQSTADTERRLTPTYGYCIEANPSTAGMILCADAERERQDAALNARYAQVMARLNPRQQATLRRAQRAWITYRDARCASLYDEDWGTLSRVSAADCLVTMTAARVADLQDHPPGGEGR